MTLYQATEGGSTRLLDRSEVEASLTWDLSPMYESPEAFDARFKETQTKIEALKAYEGSLFESADRFAEFVLKNLEAAEAATDLYVYSHLQSDQDTTNSDWSAVEMRARSLMVQLESATAWFEPALLEMDEAKLWDFLAEREDLAYARFYLQNILDAKAHKLSAKEEGILAAAAEVFDQGSNIFSVLDNADMSFPTIKDEAGEDIEITHGRLGVLMENKDRRVRKDSFEGLYKVYKQFRNTYAATLAAQVKSVNVTAALRGFGSAREAALFENHIPVSVYDALLETVKARIGLLHRYVSLKKKLLKVDAFYPYDMFAPVEGLPKRRYSIEEAKAIILKAMAPLGEEVQDILKKAFAERWMDLAENRGKRSGAYSSGSYQSKPYILMTWKGTLDNLYTMAHELGHSIHSYLSRKNQPFLYAGYSIFLAEIASTTNENLLTDYLLETETDPATRKALLLNYIDGFKGTVFRQTQFARFEHEMVKTAQEGRPLTAELLTELYAGINKEFYGKDLAETEEIGLEWARIPHFYYNFYVYQYATGFSAATAFASKIKTEGKKAVEAYLGFLRSGSSDHPIEILKKAGLDMSTNAPIEAALDRFEAVLTELEAGL